MGCVTEMKPTTLTRIPSISTGSAKAEPVKPAAKTTPAAKADWLNLAVGDYNFDGYDDMPVINSTHMFIATATDAHIGAGAAVARDAVDPDQRAPAPVDDVPLAVGVIPPGNSDPGS